MATRPCHNGKKMMAVAVGAGSKLSRVGRYSLFLQNPLALRCISKPINHQHERFSSTNYYNFPLVESMQTSFTWIHDVTHLPWWGTIILTTVALRGAVTLPLAIYQNKILAKIENIQPYLNEYSEALKHNVVIKCKRAKKSAEEADKTFKKELRTFTYQLYRNEGCNPLKLYLLPWTQLPLWFIVSFSLRNMSGYFPGAVEETPLPIAGFQTEGILWLADLSIPDPFYVLPIVLMLTNLTNIELNAMRRQSPSTKQRIITNIMRSLSVMIGVVATQVPTAMSLYWATSSVYGLTQNIVLKFPKVRRSLSIPRSQSESQTPFVDMNILLKEKLNRFIEIQRR